MSEIKKNLSTNLINLRKKKNITQLELANLLNYSDKSISKWECGETIPDIEVLQRIAIFYDVTIDDLISENPVEPLPETKKKTQIEQNNKIIITLLIVSIVWIAATIIQVQIKLVYDKILWMAYVWAIPLSFLILTAFNAIWGIKKFSILLSSALVWTLLATVYLEFITYNIWVIFFIGLPIQVSIILWNQLSKNSYKRRQLLK